MMVKKRKKLIFVMVGFISSLFQQPLLSRTDKNLLDDKEVFKRHIPQKSSYRRMLWERMKDTFWGKDELEPVGAHLFYKYDKETEVHRLLDSFFTPSESIIKENEWNELDIDRLLDRLDRTLTCYGKWGLKKSIAPHGNKEELLSNQERIRILLNQHDLYVRLRQIMEQIGQHDDALLAYFNPRNKLHDDAKRLYYPPLFENMNYNRWSLEATYGAELSKAVLCLAATLGMTGVLQEGIAHIDQEENTLWNKIKKGFYLPIRYHQITPELLKTEEDKKALFPQNACTQGISHCINLNAGQFFKIYSEGSWGDQRCFFKEHWLIPDVVTIPVLGALLGAYDAMLLLRMRDTAKSLYFLFEKTERLREQLIAIAAVVKDAQRMTMLVQDYPVLADWKPMKTITTFLAKETPLFVSLNELIDLLQEDTFNQDDSPFYFRGKVLLAHRLLRDVSVQFVPLLQSIGQIDALLSVVKLYKEHEKGRASFCFAQLTEGPNAACELIDFWQPLITTTDIVFNSITCGMNGNANKLIFTGPNGGGKSTVTNAVTHAFVLGLSWGIVPAKKASLTLLKGIRTARRPQEDIVKGLSSFMAEKLRMNQIYRFITTHQNNEPILVVLDEPYKGTVESESAKRVYTFGTDVAPFNNCMILMATHLEKPIELEQDTHGAFANYQLEFDEVDKDVLEPTYRLLPGPADWWFNDEAKRSRYIDSILFGDDLENGYIH